MAANTTAIARGPTRGQGPHRRGGLGRHPIRRARGRDPRRRGGEEEEEGVVVATVAATARRHRHRHREGEAEGGAVRATRVIPATATRAEVGAGEGTAVVGDEMK